MSDTRLTILVPFVLLLHLQGINTAPVPCRDPAREGFPYTFSTVLENETSVISWVREDIFVATCSPQKLSCDTSFDYNASVKLMPDGGFFTSLTILEVTRLDHEATWKFPDGSVCDLEVYAMDHDPICNGVSLSEIDSSWFVKWTCSISKVYPPPMCNFNYTMTVSEVFWTAVPSKNVQQNISVYPRSTDYYNLDVCEMLMPIQAFKEEIYIFNVNMYPNVTRFDSVLKTLKSDKIHITLPGGPQVFNCPSGTDVKGDYIKEGTQATCTCRALDVGNPPGAPEWVDGNFKPVIAATGENGVDSILKVQYNPQDELQRYFCRVRSALGEGPAIPYQPLFAYGPRDIDIETKSYTEHLEVICKVEPGDISPKKADITLYTDDVNPTLVATSDLQNLYHVPSNTGANFSIRCLATNVIFPDLKAEVLGNVEIKTPPMAWIDEDCPVGEHVRDGYIKAGSTATCTCRLQEIGNPPGRAQWVDMNGEYVDQDTGDTFSKLTLMYNEINPSPVYICTASSSLGPSPKIVRYGPQFAYGPTEVSLFVSEPSSEVPYCLAITFFYVECIAATNTSNPDDSDVDVVVYRLKADIKGRSESTSPRKIFMVTPESGGLMTVKCIARNVIFPELKTEKEINVTIRAVPTLSPSMTLGNGRQLKNNESVIATSGETLTVGCHVEGGHPVVTHTVISCPGHQNVSMGPNVNLTFAVDKTMLHRSCLCSAVHVTACYNKTTNISLSVYFPVEFESDDENIKYFTIESDKDLEIEIPIVGYPMTISFPNHQDIINRYIVSYLGRGTSEGTVTIKRSSLKPEDSAHYHMIITNGVGVGIDYFYHVTVTEPVSGRCPQDAGYLYPDPDNCHNYRTCESGIFRVKQCPHDGVFSEIVGACVKVNSPMDTCTRQRPSGQCANIGGTTSAATATIPHPSECNRYFRCRQPSTEDETNYSEEECDYPYMYDSLKQRCTHFTQTFCGVYRKETKDICDYEGSSNSCFGHAPSCSSLPDGRNAYPGRNYQPYFIHCQSERLVNSSECHGIKRFFHPSKLQCVTAWEIPLKYGGATVVCDKNQPSGLFKIIESERLYKKCPGNMVQVCANNYVFDEITRSCVIHRLQNNTS